MTKPRDAWREEPWWHWDWPGRPGQYLTPGSGVQALSGPGEAQPPVAAKIIVPEAQSVTGWRDWWVYRDPPPTQPKPGMGFR